MRPRIGRTTMGPTTSPTLETTEPTGRPDRAALEREQAAHTAERGRLAVDDPTSPRLPVLRARLQEIAVLLEEDALADRTRQADAVAAAAEARAQQEAADRDQLETTEVELRPAGAEVDADVARLARSAARVRMLQAQANGLRARLGITSRAHTDRLMLEAVVTWALRDVLDAGARQAQFVRYRGRTLAELLAPPAPATNRKADDV
jgi:hypothetical protein